MAYRLAQAAEDQIDRPLLKSAKTHSLEAASRYSQLILIVIRAVGDNPNPVGSIEVPWVNGIRAYPIRQSRLKVEPGRRVGAPRHLVIDRLATDGAVEILGLVHDRIVLSRAARKLVRAAAKD